MRFDVDAFLERAAIREFDGNQTRFEAETEAARAQGVERWRAMKFVAEASNADGSGFTGRHGDQAHALDGKRDADVLPGMQRQPQEKARPMSFGKQEVGRDSGALLALRGQHGQEVQR